MLERLPLEILQSIVQEFLPPRPFYLKTHRWTSDFGYEPQHLESISPQDIRIGLQVLCALCLVSKPMKAVAQRMIYTSIVLIGDSKHGYNKSHRVGRPLPFIRTLCCRRDLAGMVQEVFSFSDFFDEIVADASEVWDTLRLVAETLGVDLQTAWFQRGQDSLSAVEHPDLKEALIGFSQRLALGQSEEASEELRKELHFNRHFLVDELRAVVIALLPNLKRLTMDGCDDTSIPLLSFNALGIQHLPIRTFTADSALLGILPILEKAVDLEVLSINEAVLTSNSGLMTAKSLKDCITSKSIPFMPRLRTLRLTQAAFTGKWLGELLSRCTGGLHTFIHERTPFIKRGKVLYFNDKIEECVDFEYQQVFPLREFGQLARHQHSLETLSIDVQIVDRKFILVPSLKEFTALKELIISTVSWYTSKGYNTSQPERLAELLPPNIRHLQMSGSLWVDRLKLITELENFAEEKRTGVVSFSSLQRITCDEDLMDEKEYAGVFTALSRAGVHLDKKAAQTSEKYCHFHVASVRSNVEYMIEQYDWLTRADIDET